MHLFHLEWFPANQLSQLKTVIYFQSKFTAPSVPVYSLFIYTDIIMCMCLDEIVTAFSYDCEL